MLMKRKGTRRYEFLILSLEMFWVQGSKAEEEDEEEEEEEDLDDDEDD